MSEKMLEDYALIGDGRTAALVDLDPEGVRFGMLASSSGDPADTAAMTGTWLWTAWVARDSRDESATP